MSTSAEKIIENNWDQVKKEMRKSWRELTEDQVNDINNYDDLVKALKKSYDITEDKVKEKIDKFIDQFEPEENPNRFEELKKSLHESSESAKEKIGKTADNIREKTSDWADYAINYSKENPLKLLGLGVLAAVTIKKILEK